MTSIKILAQPLTRFFSDLHPFYRWKKQLAQEGFKVSFHFNHLDKELQNADCVIIHSRYFDKGWQNTEKRTQQNEQELFNYLTELKKSVKKLIWFDEADSTGSADFGLIHLVDVFAKKQILKDTSYYTTQDGNKNLRIWLNTKEQNPNCVTFTPCPPDQLYKVKAGWCIGFNDYRYYFPRTSKLSNFLSYKLYPLHTTPVSDGKEYDLTFRGKVKYDKENSISNQRNQVLNILGNIDLKIIKGGRISKNEYIKELRKAKVSISPFGFGEICYRDYESFVAGSLLIKPSMEHLISSPDVFIPNETYIPVTWELDDLEDKLKEVASDYGRYKDIAVNGQETYTKLVNNPETFISRVKHVVN